jgi:polar amino acid transport system substrate-binding protein
MSGKTVGVTRGAVEDMVLSELRRRSAQIKRYEDNNTTLSAYLSGQVQYCATGNLVVAHLPGRTRPKRRCRVYAEGFAVLHRPEERPSRR